MNAYLQAKNNYRVKFSLLWDNHIMGVPNSLEEFRSMVKYWLDNYFLRPQYFQIEGKPVVTVFSAYDLREHAKKFLSPTTGQPMTTKELLQMANDMAKEKGLPGIYFIAGISNGEFWADFAEDNVYSALSSYNLHSGMGDDSAIASHTYSELSDDYSEHWRWLLKNAALPYLPPMTSGWDSRPWGGSTSDPLHDNSVSTPASFEAHLRSAKAQMDLYPAKTMKTGVICCWNEFGEGSYIEPTKKYQFQYLEKVKKVFGVSGN